MRMRTCFHCGARVGLRPDQVWVHHGTRSRHCSAGPIPRPQALPTPLQVSPFEGASAGLSPS